MKITEHVERLARLFNNKPRTSAHEGDYVDTCREHFKVNENCEGNLLDPWIESRHCNIARPGSPVEVYVAEWEEPMRMSTNEMDSLILELQVARDLAVWGNHEGWVKA